VKIKIYELIPLSAYLYFFKEKNAAIGAKKYK
jgi:hypothetical protein